MSSKSEFLYDRFLGIVFESCNTAHNRLFQHPISRTDYHLRDIGVILETLEETPTTPPNYMMKQLSPTNTASPISFASPSRSSSSCDSVFSPSFTFSPPTSRSTISCASSLSSVQSATAQGPHSFSSPLSATSLSSNKILKCPICGYEPDEHGIQKWKAGNLKRHMRSTHNGKRYECTFEGCGRVFIGRKDNLLSHQRDKGHLPATPSPFVICEDDFVMEDV